MGVRNPNPIEVRDEGATQGRALTMDFTGAGVTASVSGLVATVNVPAAVGGNAWTEFTKDLGAARRSGTFDITGLAGLTAGKPVQLFQSAAAIASKGNARDEPEMDLIKITGYVVDANTIRAYWESPSVVVGTYAFAYLVSA